MKGLLTRGVIEKLLCGVLGVLIGVSDMSFANPEGGSVVAGTASISSPTSSTVQINQTSDKAIINWQSYNIATHENVNYQQPSPSSIALNRINPANGPSSIYGSITANGHVWLINPAGIWFSPSAYVNVGGLLATTANISDQDFMSGNYHFVQSPDYNGAIINEGIIKTSEAGLVALVGSGVVNNGYIEANLGNVVLAAGSEFTINFSGNDLIGFSVDREVLQPAHDQNGNTLRDGVKNTGTIVANGGKVLVTAHTAGQILDNAINMQGIVQARSVSVKNGEIILMGSGNSPVKVTGKLIASGKSKGQKGGKVKVLSDHAIIIDKNAEIDVSGSEGGGEVLIGGDYQGKNPNIINAMYTFVGQEVLINADALDIGNGGRVILWADETTQFYGKISARGGVNGGDGGLIETSGKGYLDVEGSFVDTRAPFGITGTWLLDPTNIFIATNQASATTAGMSGTDSSANTASDGTFQASGAVQDSLLTISNLQTALASSNVIVTTTNTSGTGVGNITVVDPLSWSSSNRLTLTAANNILINAAITTGAAGSALILNAAGSVTQTAVIGGSGGLTKQGAGSFTMSQANTYSGATAVNAGAITLSGSGTATSTTFTVNQGTTLTLDNSGTNHTNRLSDTNALTLTGGELVVIGNSGANTTESIGALTLSSGYSTVTLTPNAATNTQVTFASFSRSTGAGILFRGINLGMNTVASQTANNSNIVFTTAPTLIGGGGNSGTATVSILAGAIGASGASGNTSSGTDFVTYNPPTGAVNGLRPLLTSSEYTATPAANVNLKLTANGSSNAVLSLNSILLSGGVTYDIDTGGTPNTVTIGGASLSGNILSINGTNTIQPTRAGGATFDFSTGEANIFAVTDLTFGSRSIVTGSGGITKNGAGVLLENRSVAISGGLIVNAGTLRSGIANAFSTAQALTVRAPSTFDLNGFDNSILTLSLDSGATSGASVTTGAGTLTLGGAVTLNVNGSGTTGASISGNLALDTTRIFTINDGTASNDLTISAVISGAGLLGITKEGSGTLTLSGSNSYRGKTTVSAGTLSFNSIASVSGGNSALGAPTTAANGTIDLGATGILSYTGTGHSSDRVINLTGSGGTIDASGSGALTFSGGVTGNTFNLILTGTGAGTESGVIATTSGALTKNGTGTWTLSNIANTYTGQTTINAGTLSVAKLANGGVNSSLGATSAATAILLGSSSAATLSYTGGTDSTDRLITINGTGGGTIQATAAGTLTLAGAIGNGGNSLTFDANTGNITVTSVISGAGSLTKSGTGTLTLSNIANTYTGQTTINAGTLSVAKLADGGVNSSLGATSAATAILLGSSSAATLSYTGGTDSTNRLITMNGTGGGTIQATAAGTLTLTGNISGGGNALTFDTNTGNITVSSVISGTGTTLTKNGSGALTLSATNTYSGITSVNVGTLILTNVGALGSTSSTSVISGATLDLNFSSATLSNTNTITLNGTGVGGNGALTLSGSTITLNNPITLNSDSTIGGAGSGTMTLGGAISGGSNLTITLNNAGISLPVITLTNSKNLSVTAGGAISQTGAITGTTLTAKTLSNGSAAITLANSGNAFTTVDLRVRNAADSAVASGAISYINATGFTVSAIETTGNITLNAGTGNLILSPIGNSSAIASSPNNVTLTGGTITANSDIAINGAISFNGDVSLGGISIDSPDGATFGNDASTDQVTLNGSVSVATEDSPITFDASISGASNDLTLDSGSLGDITFNGNVSLDGLTITNTHDFTNNGTISVSSYLQEGGNTTELGFSTLNVVGNASITSYIVNGTVHVGSLTLIVSYGNLTGTVGGASGAAAIAKINYTKPPLGRLFFDGIDMGAGVPPSPTPTPTPVPSELTINTTVIGGLNSFYTSLVSGWMTPVGGYGQLIETEAGKVGVTRASVLDVISKVPAIVFVLPRTILEAYLPLVAAEVAVRGVERIREARGTFEQGMLILLLLGIIAVIIKQVRKEIIVRKTLRIAEVGQLRQEFLQAMPFKLRTSLNELIGFSKLLQADQAAYIPEEMKIYLENMLASANEIVGLITDVTEHVEVEPDNIERLFKRESFATLSFKLRTSLNNIYGFAELISEKLSDISDTQKEYVGYILQGASEMVQLISEMPSLAENELDRAEEIEQRNSLVNLTFNLRIATNDIRGFAELIYNGQIGQITEEQKSYLANIVSGSNEILCLIDQLSELTQDKLNYAGIPLEAKLSTILSFKLRTALNDVIGFAQLMYSGQAGELSAEQKEYMENILSGSTNIMRLVPVTNEIIVESYPSE